MKYIVIGIAYGLIAAIAIIGVFIGLGIINERYGDTVTMSVILVLCCVLIGGIAGWCKQQNQNRRGY